MGFFFIRKVMKDKLDYFVLFKLVYYSIWGNWSLEE